MEKDHKITRGIAEKEKKKRRKRSKIWRNSYIKKQGNRGKRRKKSKKSV